MATDNMNIYIYNMEVITKKLKFEELWLQNIPKTY